MSRKSILAAAATVMLVVAVGAVTVLSLSQASGSADVEVAASPETTATSVAPTTTLPPTTTTTTTVPPTTTTTTTIPFPQDPEDWMVAAALTYLENWGTTMTADGKASDDAMLGDLTGTGQRWLNESYHPVLGCTEAQIRRVIGAVWTGMHVPEYITVMSGDVDSMQVVGYEDGFGFVLQYEHTPIRDFGSGPEEGRSDIRELFVDPVSKKAHQMFRSCPGT